ncbi:MAG: hypothetical protein J2P26_11910 [Nocardiopsaceae bacterium]|nr:hypothetical protein [Nocardiopsaceae bacterium]
MPVFAVITARGPRWDYGRDIRDQDGWEAHAAFMDGLVDQGTVILGGPIDGEPGELALLAMRADSADRVRSAFDPDPWVAGGLLRLASVRSWTIWLDGTAPAPTACFISPRWMRTVAGQVLAPHGRRTAPPRGLLNRP